MTNSFVCGEIIDANFVTCTDELNQLRYSAELV